MPLLPSERRLLSQALDVDGDGATRKGVLNFLGKKVDDSTIGCAHAEGAPCESRLPRPPARGELPPKPKVSEKTKEALAVWITLFALGEDNRG